MAIITRHISIPCWMLAIGLALPAIARETLLRVLAKPPSGHCQNCGYDLRRNAEPLPRVWKIALETVWFSNCTSSDDSGSLTVRRIADLCADCFPGCAGARNCAQGRGFVRRNFSLRRGGMMAAGWFLWRRMVCCAQDGFFVQDGGIGAGRFVCAGRFVWRRTDPCAGTLISAQEHGAAPIHAGFGGRTDHTAGFGRFTRTSRIVADPFKDDERVVRSPYIMMRNFYFAADATMVSGSAQFAAAINADPLPLGLTECKPWTTARSTRSFKVRISPRRRHRRGRPSRLPAKTPR